MKQWFQQRPDFGKDIDTSHWGSPNSSGNEDKGEAERKRGVSDSPPERENAFFWVKGEKGSLPYNCSQGGQRTGNPVGAALKRKLSE